MRTGIPSTGIKPLGNEVDNLPLSKNVWISSLIYPYTFMSCTRTTFIYTGQRSVLRVTHQVFHQQGNTHWQPLESTSTILSPIVSWMWRWKEKSSISGKGKVLHLASFRILKSLRLESVTLLTEPLELPVSTREKLRAADRWDRLTCRTSGNQVLDAGSRITL